MLNNRKGFTLVELMIVIAIIGILAGIAIPNFLDLKDKAIWGTARANLEVARTALAAYATDSHRNQYPLGSLDFAGFRSLVPKANLPFTETLTKLRTGSFLYTSTDGSTFELRVNVDNRAYDLMVASPSGITPDTYEAYAR